MYINYNYSLQFMFGKRIFVTVLFALTMSVSFAFISSNSTVWAVETSCTYTPDKKTAFCSTDEEDATVYRCEQQKGGKTWKCNPLPAELSTDNTDTPINLKDAVNKAQITKGEVLVKDSNDTSTDGSLPFNDRFGNNDLLKNNNILKDEEAGTSNDEPPTNDNEDID